MATLSAQTITTAGVGPTYAAATAAGDKVPAGSGTYIHVKNGHTAAQSVTLVTPITAHGLAVEDQGVSVPAGGERKIAVPAERYRDPADGLASLTYSGATALTIGCFRI